MASFSRYTRADNNPLVGLHAPICTCAGSWKLAVPAVNSRWVRCAGKGVVEYPRRSHGKMSVCACMHLPFPWMCQRGRGVSWAEELPSSTFHSATHPQTRSVFRSNYVCVVHYGGIRYASTGSRPRPRSIVERSRGPVVKERAGSVTHPEQVVGPYLGR